MIAVQRAGWRAAGAIAVGIFAWWTVADGGYAPGTWYPGALLLLGALAATARPSRYRTLPPPARWALAALAAYTLWSFCSIGWADARGDAWDGANRTLLYLSVFALFAVVPWTAGEAATGLAALPLAIAGAGLWAFAHALTGADLTVFSDGRLTAPIGYENASAALFLLAFWVAVLLAVRRGTPAPACAVLLAAAGVLLHLTVLAQSRGSLVAGVVTLAAALALVAERRRLILVLGALAAATLASLPALLGVYDRSAATGVDLVPAALAIGLCVAMLGAALRRLDRARRLNPLTDRADLVAGALNRGSGDREGARRAFLAALARDDRNWHPHVELALLDLQAGRRGSAQSRLALAERLRPGESLIAASRAAARSGQPPSPELLDGLAAETLPGPLGRRAVECAPDLGLARSCDPGVPH